MESPDNREQVTNDMNKYDDCFTELVAAYTHHIELIETEKGQNVAKKMLDELDASVFEFKQDIYTWLSSIRESSLPASENSGRHRAGSRRSCASSRSSGHSSRRRSPSENSDNSVSSKSSRSSAISNTSKKSLEHKAEAAGLRAEAGVLKRKREAELEAELLEYERKIKRAEAMEKVYKEEERKNLEGLTEDEDEGEGKENEGKVRTKNKSPKRKGKIRIGKIKERIEKRKEKKGKRDRSKAQKGFDETLLQVLQINSAPQVDIDEFSGDVLEFQYFMETFREVVERAIPDERGRLTRLIQKTSGEPKEMIRHCIYEDKSTCYTEAMKLLKQHYGDPHRIATAYMKELVEWPKLSANNSNEFRSFNRFLIKCKIYKKKDNFLMELDSAETLRTLVLKLPLHLQDKWVRKADDIRTKRNKIPNFLDFCDFIDVESRIVNDPLFSREALHGTSKLVNTPPTMASLATGLEMQPVSQTCHMCSSTSHDLDDCEEYKKLSRSARVKFLYEKKLCYACYGNKT